MHREACLGSKMIRSRIDDELDEMEKELAKSTNDDNG